MVKPIERVLRSGLFGPWDAPDVGLTELPPALNPARHRAWGARLVPLLPELHAARSGSPTGYLTYHYWPTSYNTHVFEGTLLLRAAEERSRAPRAGARGGDVQGVRAPGRQHARGHAVDDRVTRAGHRVPADDQEILLRHLHHGHAATSSGTRAADGCGRRLSQEADPCPTTFPASSPTSSRSRDWSLPSPSASATPSASPARWTSSRRSTTRPSRGSTTAIEYLDRYALTTLPDDATHLLWLCYSLVNVSFPVEVWRQPRVPDSGAADHGRRRRARGLIARWRRPRGCEPHGRCGAPCSAMPTSTGRRPIPIRSPPSSRTTSPRWPGEVWTAGWHAHPTATGACW